jgi:predicted naringenin-chalcone synthase
MFAAISERLAALEESDKEKSALLDFVRLLLIGSRDRFVQNERFLWQDKFSDHAASFQAAIEESASAICARIEARPPDKPFDAVFGISSEGMLLPGIAERVVSKLGKLANDRTMQLDIGSAGCTATTRAMQLVASSDIENVLIVAMEPTSTMADPKSLVRSNWQGICTFGDGTAAAWISRNQGDGAIAIDRTAAWRGEANDLIQWHWGTDYYRFGIAEPEQFETKVRREVLQAIAALQIDKIPGARWAIHPAGVLLLVSLAKKLGIERGALEPSIQHFRSCSNMSSVSILHILAGLMANGKPGESIQWLSMGAGFHVAYGAGTCV